MAEIYGVIRGCCKCQDVGSKAYKVCLPENIDCLPTCTDYLVGECGNLWCDRMCHLDRPYTNPFIQGDQFSIQLAEVDRFNANPEMPTLGWNDFVVAELCDKDGNVISADVADFASEYLVGWNGERSYQTLIVDTNLITEPCWNIKFTVYDSDSQIQNEFCTEPFEEVLLDCGRKTVWIESEHNCEDCCGFYYGSAPEEENYSGTSNYTLTNGFRIPACIVQSGITVDKEEFGKKATGSTTACIYSLRLQESVPDYVANKIFKQHFAGAVVYIDGEAYNFGSPTLDNRLSTSNMFLFDVQGVQECSIKFNCKC